MCLETFALKTNCVGGRLRGRVVKFTCSAAAAQGSDPHRSSGHVEAASHILRLEERATKIYNCVRGVWGDKQSRKKKKFGNSCIAS